MSEKSARSSWSSSAGGHVTLTDRSPHIEAVARLGNFRPLLRLPSIHYLAMDRVEARRRLLLLPRTDDIDVAIDAVDRARLGAPAMPVVVDLLLTSFLEVVPTARTVRKAELISAAKEYLRVSGPVLAAVLRAKLPRAREAPTLGEISEAAALEMARLEALAGDLARLDGLRSAAVVALDWRDPDDAAFLAEVGDPVPPGWPGVGPDLIDW